ncbi:uncharacterized protein SPPG_01392 [Spizellomyces punctatus DAOM BR117]|uniref:Uncharacterized protein n=1 Tax=Spizellomyces punctatus (strain DAOM BR117) TaxID=645134 RepID=A0A0L0HS81_SPIPD|nr:uncharacterized protein SPPG_01392 [Spizellomyces punctatus DAOM BR117]KND03942.1 hypothetical protein SPPG_01392 [Spizellomyces punctatus DAOM BR117]|eukprot:XP_016611981.1 hypothetical protein SPPG_01392 [Spizellomyces punctatus DAOM BR117]
MSVQCTWLWAVLLVYLAGAVEASSSSATIDYGRIGHDRTASGQLMVLPDVEFRNASSWIIGVALVAVVGIGLGLVLGHIGKMRMHRSWISSPSPSLLDVAWNGRCLPPIPSAQTPSYDTTFTQGLDKEEQQESARTRSLNHPVDIASSEDDPPGPGSSPHPCDQHDAFTPHHLPLNLVSSSTRPESPSLECIQDQSSHTTAAAAEPAGLQQPAPSLSTPASAILDSPAASTKSNSRKKNRHSRNNSFATSLDGSTTTSTAASATKPKPNPSPRSSSTGIPRSGGGNDKRRAAKAGQNTHDYSANQPPTAINNKNRHGRDLHKSASTTQLQLPSSRNEKRPVNEYRELKQVTRAKASHARSFSGSHLESTAATARKHYDQQPETSQQHTFAASPIRGAAWSSSFSTATSPSNRLHTASIKAVSPPPGLSEPDVSAARYHHGWTRSAPSPPPSYEAVMEEARRETSVKRTGFGQQQWYSPFVSGLSLDLDLNNRARGHGHESRVIKPDAHSSEEQVTVPSSTPVGYAPPLHAPGFHTGSKGGQDKGVVSRLRRQQTRQDGAQQGQQFSLFDRRLSFTVGRSDS